MIAAVQSLAAQSTWTNSDRMLTFTRGWYSCDSGVRNSMGNSYALSLTEYRWESIGTTYGLSYVAGLNDNINLVSIPLGFSWSMSPGYYTSTTTNSYRTPRGGRSTTRVTTTIPFDVDAFVGISPTYVVSGYSSSSRTDSSIYDSGNIYVNNRLGATFDTSISCGFKAWRFKLFVEAAYSYYLTPVFKVNDRWRSDTRSFLRTSLGLSVML